MGARVGVRALLGMVMVSGGCTHGGGSSNAPGGLPGNASSGTGAVGSEGAATGSSGTSLASSGAGTRGQPASSRASSWAASASSTGALDAGATQPACANPQDGWRHGECVRAGYPCPAVATCDIGYTCSTNHECVCADSDPSCGVVCNALHPVCPSYRNRCTVDGKCAGALSEACFFPQDCAPDGGMCDGITGACILPGSQALGSVCASSAVCQSGLCGLQTCIARCSDQAPCSPALYCAHFGNAGANGCIPLNVGGPAALVGPLCTARNDECAPAGGMSCVVGAGPGCVNVEACAGSETTQAGAQDEYLCTNRQKCVDNTDCAGAWSVCSDFGPAGQRCGRTAHASFPLEWPEWLLPPDHPLGYTFDASTVRDPVTGLTWQRVVPPDTYTWSGAKAYCAGLSLAGAGAWRLPTLTELQSIVDYTLYSPSINPSAFPSTPAEAFWSASPVVGNISNYAWYVFFFLGATSGGYMGNSLPVRCVR